MKRTGILLCLIGPAAGGKTTLAKALLQKFGATVSFSVSVTSRPARSGEVQGESYHFVSRAEFDERIKAGAFVEWEEVHGNLYGTLKEALTKSVVDGKDLILDIDIAGALNIKKLNPQDTVIVFIVPPSSKVLVERILKRGSVTPEELSRRLDTARIEYAKALELSKQFGKIDYFVVNDDRLLAEAQVESILEAERSRLSRLDDLALRTICRVDV